MADGNPIQTIPNLPPAIALAGPEQFWINQAGVDRRTSLVDILAWVTRIVTSPAFYVTIGDTPPPNPYIGMLWFDSVGLQTYIWYVDPSSAQWVPVSNPGWTIQALTERVAALEAQLGLGK
jgi:hypothetical protein